MVEFYMYAAQKAEREKRYTDAKDLYRVGAIETKDEATRLKCLEGSARCKLLAEQDETRTNTIIDQAEDSD